MLCDVIEIKERVVIDSRRHILRKTAQRLQKGSVVLAVAGVLDGWPPTIFKNIWLKIQKSSRKACLLGTLLLFGKVFKA